MTALFERLLRVMPWINPAISTSDAALNTSNLSARLRSLIVLVAILLMFLPQTGSAQNTALILDSPTGDWVGSGWSWYYTSSSASFIASTNWHNGVSIAVYMGDECWHAEFAAPNQAPLTVGTYDRAGRYPSEGSFEAGLSVSGGYCIYGHGCDFLNGSFIVTELTQDGSGEITSFHAKFSQSCERYMPELHGEVFFNALAEMPPVHHITSPDVLYGTQGQPVRYQITASRPADQYAAVGLPSGLTVDGTTGWITGTPLEAGLFSVDIRAAGPDGSAVSTLTLTIDPPGRSTGPFTAVYLLSVLGEPLTHGNDHTILAGDGTFTGYRGNTHYLGVDARPWAVFDSPPDRSGYFNMRLDGPLQVLMPGTYFDTDPGNGRPNLSVVLGEDPPDFTTGSFTVKEVSTYPDFQLEHFRGSFVQFSNQGLLSPLRGWVWYKAENVITSAPYAIGKEGQPFTYQVIANNEPSSYHAEGLPTGLVLYPQTGLMTGTPLISGAYTVTLSASGPTTTASDELLIIVKPRRVLANISTRARVGVGENSLIGGFIVIGPDSKKVIVRAIGPSLGNSGVANPLDDPVLELHDQSGAVLAQNDDWRSNQTQVEATGLSPADDRESAIVATLAPGGYTAIVTGKNSSTGVGLVEVYDIDPAMDSQLANISTRSFVDLNEDVLIGGFIVTGGNGNISSRILIRALGPSLAYSGVQGYLQDPTLDVHDANGVTLISNDNWVDDYSQATDVGSTGLGPGDPYDAAVMVVLSPGSYTAVVRGTGNGTGVGLIDAYQLDN